MSEANRPEEIAQQAHEALQRLRGLDPSQPPVEPVAQGAWLLETNGGRRHPLDVIASASVNPALKVRGFQRKGRTWNRRVGGLVHVINLQGSKYNVLTQRSPCLFYVNIGVFVPEVQELVQREPAPEFVHEYQCQVRHRLNVLMGNRSMLIMALDPDRTLEQQGEQVARSILEVGVSYLDQFTSLDALYAVVREEAAKDIGANQWVLAYAGAKLQDTDGAEKSLQALAAHVGQNIALRQQLERVASALGLHVTLPALRPLPTRQALRAGMEILAKALPDEIDADWRRSATEVGASVWPRQVASFQRRGQSEEWQLDSELIHFADADMAEQQLPVRTPLHDGFDMIEGLGDSAARRFVMHVGTAPTLIYVFRVGPVRCTLRLTRSGRADDGARMPLAPNNAEPEALRVARLQERQLRLVVSESASSLAVQTPSVENPGTAKAEDEAPLLPVQHRAVAWRLELADCTGLHDADDVQRTIERVRELGLAPTLGPWEWQGGTPQAIEDVRQWMDQVHRESDVWKRWKDSGRKLARSKGTELWNSAAVRPGMNWPVVQFGINRYGRDNWHLSVWAGQRDHSKARVPLEDYAASWAELLEGIAVELRPLLRPKLAILYASESYIDLVEDLERGALLVGWRTWYAPAIVERFGRQFLLGLPDETQLLADGSIAHKLAVAPADMVLPKRGKFAALRQYLQERAVEVAWPRL